MRLQRHWQAFWSLYAIDRRRCGALAGAVDEGEGEDATLTLLRLTGRCLMGVDGCTLTNPHVHLFDNCRKKTTTQASTSGSASSPCCSRFPPPPPPARLQQPQLKPSQQGDRPLLLLPLPLRGRSTRNPRRASRSSTSASPAGTCCVLRCAELLSFSFSRGRGAVGVRSLTRFTIFTHFLTHRLPPDWPPPAVSSSGLAGTTASSTSNAKPPRKGGQKTDAALAPQSLLLVLHPSLFLLVVVESPVAAQSAAGQPRARVAAAVPVQQVEVMAMGEGMGGDGKTTGRSPQKTQPQHRLMVRRESWASKGCVAVASAAVANAHNILQHMHNQVTTRLPSQGDPTLLAWRHRNYPATTAVPQQKRAVVGAAAGGVGVRRQWHLILEFGSGRDCQVR